MLFSTFLLQYLTFLVSNQLYPAKTKTIREYLFSIVGTQYLVFYMIWVIILMNTKLFHRKLKILSLTIEDFKNFYFSKEKETNYQIQLCKNLLDCR